MRLLVLLLAGNTVLCYRRQESWDELTPKTISGPEPSQTEEQGANESVDTLTSTMSSSKHQRAIPNTWIHPDLRKESDNAHDQVAHEPVTETKKKKRFPKAGIDDEDSLSSVEMIEFMSGLDDTENEFWLSIADGIGHNIRKDPGFHEHLERNNISSSSLLQHTADENAGHHHLLHRVVKRALAGGDPTDDSSIKQYCRNPVANTGHSSIYELLERARKITWNATTMVARAGVNAAKQQNPTATILFKQCMHTAKDFKEEFKLLIYKLLDSVKKFAQEEYHFITKFLRWELAWKFYPPSVSEVVGNYAGLFPTLGFKCQPLTPCLKAIFTGLNLLKDVVMSIASGLLKMILLVSKYVYQTLRCMIGFSSAQRAYPPDAAPPSIQSGSTIALFNEKSKAYLAARETTWTVGPISRTSAKMEKLNADTTEKKLVWFTVVDLDEGYRALWHEDTKRFVTQGSAITSAKLELTDPNPEQKLSKLHDHQNRERFKFIRCPDTGNVALWSKVKEGYVTMEAGGRLHVPRAAKTAQAEAGQSTGPVVDPNRDTQCFKVEPWEDVTFTETIKLNPKPPETGESLYNSEKLLKDECWKHLRLKGGFNFEPQKVAKDGVIFFQFGTCPLEFYKWGPNLLACAKNTVKRVAEFFGTRNHVDKMTTSYFAKDNCNDHAVGICDLISRTVKCKYKFTKDNPFVEAETKRSKMNISKLWKTDEQLIAARVCDEFGGIYALLTKIDGQVRCAKPAYDKITWNPRDKDHYEKSRDNKVTPVNMKLGCELVVKNMKDLLNPKKCENPKSAEEAHAQCRKIFKCSQYQDDPQRVQTNWEDYFVRVASVWARKQIETKNFDGEELSSTKGMLHAERMVKAVAEAGTAFTDSVQGDHAHRFDFKMDEAGKYADTVWLSHLWQDDCFYMRDEQGGAFILDEPQKVGSIGKGWNDWAKGKVRELEGKWANGRNFVLPPQSNTFKAVYQGIRQEVFQRTGQEKEAVNFWYKYKNLIGVDKPDEGDATQCPAKFENLDRGHKDLHDKVKNARRNKIQHKKIRILAKVPIEMDRNSIVLESSGWEGVHMQVRLSPDQYGWMLTGCTPTFKCRGVPPGKARLEHFKISMAVGGNGEQARYEKDNDLNKYKEAIASGFNAKQRAATKKIPETRISLYSEVYGLRVREGQVLETDPKDLADQEQYPTTPGDTQNLQPYENEKHMLHLAATECLFNAQIKRVNEKKIKKSLHKGTKPELTKVSWNYIPLLVSGRGKSTSLSPLDAATQGEWMSLESADSTLMHAEEFQKRAPNKLDILLAQNHFTLLTPILDGGGAPKLLYNGRDPTADQLEQLGLALELPRQGLYATMCRSSEEIVRSILRGRKILTGQNIWKEFLEAGDAVDPRSPVQIWKAPEWAAHKDESGRIFYENLSTGKKQLEPPEVPREAGKKGLQEMINDWNEVQQQALRLPTNLAHVTLKFYPEVDATDEAINTLTKEVRSKGEYPKEEEAPVLSWPDSRPASTP